MTLPFLPVQSEGGPFPDKAYAAGWQMGLIDASLMFAVKYKVKGPFNWVIYEECLTQVDLIFMQYGMVITEQESHDGFIFLTVMAAKVDGL